MLADCIRDRLRAASGGDRKFAPCVRVSAVHAAQRMVELCTPADADDVCPVDVRAGLFRGPTGDTVDEPQLDVAREPVNCSRVDGEPPTSSTRVARERTHHSSILRKARSMLEPPQFVHDSAFTSTSSRCPS